MAWAMLTLAPRPVQYPGSHSPCPTGKPAPSALSDPSRRLRAPQASASRVSR